MKPRLLDLFCGAGGCAVGYSRAGFEVVGVDSAPMSRFPFEFHQADALEYLAEHGHEFDAIHASPPCQAYSTLRHMPHAKKHPDLVAVTRAALLAANKPYVIENVPGAPLIRPLIEHLRHAATARPGTPAAPQGSSLFIPSRSPSGVGNVSTRPSEIPLGMNPDQRHATDEPPVDAVDGFSGNRPPAPSK